MSLRYEQTDAARFSVGTVGGREQIAIPAPRRPFTALFLLVWLGMWTFGGVSAVNNLSSRGAEPFLILWLCAWALGEAAVAASLVWMFFGAETLRMMGPDLEVGYGALGLSRRKLYRGSDIRGLAASAPQLFGQYNQMSLPFLVRNKTGSVKFSYGARTVYLAPGLDETEGKLIVDRLLQRLPSTASE